MSWTRYRGRRLRRMSEMKKIDLALLDEAISTIANLMTRKTQDGLWKFVCPFCSTEYTHQFGPAAYGFAKNHLYCHIMPHAYDHISRTEAKWGIQLI